MEQSIESQIHDLLVEIDSLKKQQLSSSNQAKLLSKTVQVDSLMVMQAFYESIDESLDYAS